MEQHKTIHITNDHHRTETILVATYDAADRAYNVTETQCREAAHRLCPQKQMCPHCTESGNLAGCDMTCEGEVVMLSQVDDTVRCMTWVDDEVNEREWKKIRG